MKKSMDLAEIFHFKRKELESFFAPDEIRKEDTLEDLRYFLIKDAYVNKEFPLYQQEMIDIIGVKNFKKYDNLYDVILHSNIVFRLSSLFDFSIPFMQEILHMEDEENIYYLRYKTGLYLYEDKIIEGDYFTSPCYKINMLNSSSYEEAKKIFFAFEDNVNIYKNSKNPEHIVLSRVFSRLEYKKYKEEERDLNVYLFLLYNDRFMEILPEIKSQLTSYIVGVLDIKVDVRKSLLHFFFEESKNPLDLSLINITVFSTLKNQNNFSLYRKLEDYVPYSFENVIFSLKNFFNILYKFSSPEDLLDAVIYKNDNLNKVDRITSTIAQDMKENIDERKLELFISYAKIIRNHNALTFIYKFLSRVPDLEDFLIKFTLTLSTLNINYRYKNDLIVMSLFKFQFLNQENDHFFFNEYRFEVMNEQIKPILRLLPIDDIYGYTMRLARISLMVQHFDIVNFDYGRTHGYLMNNLVLPEDKVQLFPYYAEEQNMGDRAIYKRGINVHSGNRDEKTLEGVNLLFSIQGNLNKDEMEKYFSSFISYAKEKLNEKEIDILNHILGIDIITGKKVERRQRGDFGGLLEDKILLGKKLINPKELIARFFLFAETYQEDCNDIEEKCEEIIKNERENLKHGTLYGLLKSLQQDNEEEQAINAEAYGERKETHIVCNPGKIQRLVASTLSGRLKDKDGNIFNIEDREIKKQEERKERVKNLDEIHQYLQPFINLYMYEEQTRVKNVEEFFDKLYHYVWHLSQGDIAKFGKVDLDMSYVTYYSIFMTMRGNVLYINPSLSLTSHFSDMFDITYYVNKYGKKEQEAWEKAHPEEVKMLEKGREGREKMANRIEQARENQRIRRELAERYGRSPTQDEVLREKERMR
jgi:hypothetical protein